MVKRKCVKIKVSHTINEEYVKWIDSEVAKNRFGSRSHAIDYAVMQLINSEKPRKSK